MHDDYHVYMNLQVLAQAGRASIPGVWYIITSSANCIVTFVYWIVLVLDLGVLCNFLVLCTIVGAFGILSSSPGVLCSTSDILCNNLVELSITHGEVCGTFGILFLLVVNCVL